MSSREVIVCPHGQLGGEEFCIFCLRSRADAAELDVEELKSVRARGIARTNHAMAGILLLVIDWTNGLHVRDCPADGRPDIDAGDVCVCAATSARLAMRSVMLRVTQ